MTNLERLITDLLAMQPQERVLCWGGWDREYPPKYTDFREYLFRADELIAALTGQAPPPPATISVKVSASAGLRVRRAPIDGEIIGKLADGTVIVVYEIQDTKGWYRIVDGNYAGGYVSDTYVERLT